jgi:hypothetical protein
MGASSQMKSLAILIKRANWLLQEILHVENSSIFNGILNQECAVLPPSNNKAAIPEDATAIAILPCNLMLANKVL